MKNKLNGMIREAIEMNPTEWVSPSALRIGDRLTARQFADMEAIDHRRMGNLMMDDDLVSGDFLYRWEMDLIVLGLTLCHAEEVGGDGRLLVMEVNVRAMNIGKSEFPVDLMDGVFWMPPTYKVERNIWTDTSWLTRS